jgi:hypothetical protein
MSSSQNLGECGGGGDDVPLMPPREFEAGSDDQVPRCQFGEAVGVEDECAGYSSS